MPPRWNPWAGIRAVQWDWERAPKDRQVRLSAPTARVGDPVRVRMSGVEIEGVITETIYELFDLVNFWIGFHKKLRILVTGAFNASGIFAVAK
jgi:hypothetical protein